jgi:hypothetical protein
MHSPEVKSAILPGLGLLTIIYQISDTSIFMAVTHKIPLQTFSIHEPHSTSLGHNYGNAHCEIESIGLFGWLSVAKVIRICGK